MTFQLLSLLLAALSLSKGGLALAHPGLFYRFRQQQYASARLPVSVLVVPALVLLMTAFAWHATFVNYVAWGWVLTGFLTIISLLAVLNLLRWSQHRQVVHDAIAHDTQKRVRVDQALLVIGMFYLLMALWVY